MSGTLNQIEDLLKQLDQPGEKESILRSKLQKLLKLWGQEQGYSAVPSIAAARKSINARNSNKTGTDFRHPVTKEAS